jgi:ABC-2 type transport system permease protein
MNKVNYPFWVVVNKEISDHVKSWRFIILMGIILLTCMGSLYTSLTNIGAAIKPNHESIQKGIARRLCGYHDGQNS